MATKTQVINKANKLGCRVDLNSYDIAIHAPKGKLLGGELHISAYDFELYAKSEIWSNLLTELDSMIDCNGSDYCECGK